MSHLFISHASNDQEIAIGLATGLEKRGFKTWYFERDSIPGLSYLLQTGLAIKESSAVAVLVSPFSLASSQVTKEVIRAHEEGKSFLPVLCGITHEKFQGAQEEWREAFGAASSIVLPDGGLADILPRIARGLVAMGVKGEPAAGRGDPSPGPETGATADKSRFSDKRALLVDDEPAIREILKYILLNEIGFMEVRLADNGKSALEILKEGYIPALIVSDMRMPVMDGISMYREIRQSSLRDTPFLFISAYRSMSSDLHDVPFLAKPCTLKAFGDAILGLNVGRPASAARSSGGGGEVAVEKATPMMPEGDVAVLERCVFSSSARCKGQLASLGLSEGDLEALVKMEFRSHSNYLRYDFENYPLPLRSGYIAFMSKNGSRVEFQGVTKCSMDQVKLASWNDVLMLYRRASRLAYRSDPQKLFLTHGALERAVSLHLDIRVRITKHFTDHEKLPVEESLMGVEDSGDGESIVKEIAFHLWQSAKASTEAAEVGQMLEMGDLSLADATGSAVMELERSLQHIHKIITGFPPIA